MTDEFNINEPLSLKVTENFGDKEENAITAKMIHISIQQRSTKKCLTTVSGIPEDIDLPKVLKAWKKLFSCNGSVTTHPKTGEEYIALTGDHREEIAEFLIHEGIGTKEFIKIHGAEI